MKHIKLRKYIRKEISSILSESKLSENQMTTDEAFRILRDIEAVLPKNPSPSHIQLMGQALDHLQAGEITKMMDRERGLSEDEEPTKAELKKKDSVASISNKLQKLVQDMKDKAKEWKSAEGEEKEKIKTELKKMTKEKKELEKSI